MKLWVTFLSLMFLSLTSVSYYSNASPRILGSDELLEIRIESVLQNEANVFLNERPKLRNVLLNSFYRIELPNSFGLSDDQIVFLMLERAYFAKVRAVLNSQVRALQAQRSGLDLGLDSLRAITKEVISANIYGFNEFMKNLADQTNIYTCQSAL